MHLSPLQSRLAASLVASCLLILLYLVLFPPNFALAAELNEALPVVFDDVDSAVPPGPIYEAEFSAFDRSIIGRATRDVIPLDNDEPLPMNVDQGVTQPFVFLLPPVSERKAGEDRLELRREHNAPGEGHASAGAGATELEGDREDGGLDVEKRQAGQKVYISANTCLQPQPIDPSKTTGAPPQLKLYVSTSPDNTAPGPLADQATQDMFDFKEGAVAYSITTDREVYIGIYAPDSETFSGTYNVRITASTDSQYYTYSKRGVEDLILVDSDSQGALLITQSLTDSKDPNEQAAVMRTQPYVLFAHNKKDRAINGVKHSYCGLYNYAQIAATKDERQTGTVKTSMTKRHGDVPKQQFFFIGLNSSAEYIGILVKDGEDGGNLGKRQTAFERGPQVFEAMEFTTKSDHGNCALVIDLSFCDKVAYSVPSNPNFGNSSRLAEFYDNYAASVYANFDKSLAQVACEAPSSQLYSLARNCTSCAADYKDWLCSVTIPRCEDFSNTAEHLQPRAVGQPFPDGETLDEATLAPFRKRANRAAFMNSRNPLIDEMIKPGPYKEVLPCDNLCYELVRSCPASMGFGCPLPGGVGFEGNYRVHKPSEGLTCNFPGAAHTPSAGGRAVVDWGVMVVVMAVGLLVV
ncbi:stretch-activated Ca2+-permeable channel component-domain-containing protein [Chaetomium fimeti]|uniref:Stretch-activated Ca2+-permeable channel component-domain-containing protein n=1 Tax=Chaetomium fimeti TaxID=1854472 RepID=A0AAE0HJ44_9PEZI|nr:stretch-activated Ca2+-permeable channel component-domain-containing protein [Chaetomium fimeti]